MTTGAGPSHVRRCRGAIPGYSAAVRRFAKRWLPGKKTLASVLGAALLLSLFSAPASATGRHSQYRLPDHEKVLAASSTPRTPACPEQRFESFVRIEQLVSIVAPMRPRIAAQALARGEGSLPPARRRYRRTVHDRSSDQPA